MLRNLAVFDGAIRPAAPALDEARAVVKRFVAYYNDKPLHSALGYVAPRDYLEGRAERVQAERDRKLELARVERARRREAEHAALEAIAREHGAALIFPFELPRAASSAH